MSLPMKRIGLPASSESFGVDAVIGASLCHSSLAVTDEGSGPTPDEPVTVTWGALYLASRGSYFSLISRMSFPAVPLISAMMKRPFCCNYLGAAAKITFHRPPLD